MQPDSYIAPHRHLDPNKGETLIVLRGKLGFLAFDDAGNVVAQALLSPGTADWGVDIPPGTWHCTLALEADTLFFETKAGPYQALSELECAPWAPAENTPGVQAMLTRLTGYFSA